MPATPSVLAALRHALADPLSAAAVKVEVLATRLDREAPALSPRARDLGADLASAGRLLDLLAAVAAVAEEAPEESTLSSLVAGVGGETGAGDAGLRLRVRPSAAGLALRRLVAEGDPTSTMPPFAGTLSPEEIDAVVGWALALSARPEGGSAR